MTALPINEIAQVATQVDFGRGMKRIITAMLYYPARMVGSVVRGLSWCVAACKVGYGDGRRPRTTETQPRQPTVMQDRTTR